MQTQAFNVSDLFDDIPDLDARTDFDGAPSFKSDSNITVEVSETYPASGFTFSSPVKFVNGSFRAKALKFKYNIISTNTNQNLKCLTLGVNLQFPFRTENRCKQIVFGNGNVTNFGSVTTSFNSESAAKGTATLHFKEPFFTGTTALTGGTDTYLPTISISPLDLPSGGRFIITNVSGTSFTIIFKDSAGNNIDVNFTFQALGYGKGV